MIIRALFAAVFVLLCASAAFAQCPVGVTGPCTSYSDFTNSLAPVTSPTSTDRMPYVQGSTTHYRAPGVAVLTGAAGNGTTDDTATIQAAINALTNGGSLQFPVGHFCVKTGPLTITVAGVTLQGQTKGSNGTGAQPLIDTCGTDSALLAMSGAGDVVRDMSFKGSQVPGTAMDVISLNSGCSECTLDFVGAQGGRYALNATDAYEVYVLNSSMDSTYGNAIVYLRGTGGYIHKGKFDQSYPSQTHNSVTPSAGVTTLPVPNWIAAHGYTANTSFAVVGAYILQALTTGTSGSSPPAVPIYGATVTDGSVVWGLVGASTYYGVQCDTGCGFQLYVAESDFSASETSGIGITNTLGGSAPHGIVIDKDTFGTNLYNNITALSGYLLQITNNISGGGLLANGGSGISLSGAGDDNIISGNLLEVGGPTAGANGIFLNANNTNIENNICSATTCIAIASNVQHFRVIGNSCFSGFGASVTCVFVNTGSSDYYSIIGNDAGGSTTSISDGGTGTHKTILDEDSAEFGIYLNQHLRVPVPAATISSGFGSSPSISGSDTSGRITVGSGGASTGIVTLGANYQANFPNCVANDESSGIAARVAATAANQLTFGANGTPWNAGDHLTYICMGN